MAKTKYRKEIVSRFLKMIDQICADRQQTVKELCQSLILSESTISQLRGTRSTGSISADVIAEICHKYHYSPEWVLLGKGPMKQDKEQRNLQEELAHIKHILGDIITPLLGEVLKLDIKTTVKQRSALQELLYQVKDRSS